MRYFIASMISRNTNYVLERGILKSNDKVDIYYLINSSYCEELI